jgi:hypothetical protein
VRFGLDNAEGYRILFMSRGDLKPKEEFMDEGSGPPAFTSLVRVMERCMEAGAIRRDEDPTAVAFGFWARSEPEPCRPVDRMCQSVPYGRHVRR